MHARPAAAPQQPRTHPWPLLLGVAAARNCRSCGGHGLLHALQCQPLLLALRTAALVLDERRVQLLAEALLQLLLIAALLAALRARPCGGLDVRLDHVGHELGQLPVDARALAGPAGAAIVRLLLLLLLSVVRVPPAAAVNRLGAAGCCRWRWRRGGAAPAAAAAPRVPREGVELLMQPPRQLLVRLHQLRAGRRLQLAAAPAAACGFKRTHVRTPQQRSGKC
jgi:hypothetical protein